MEKFFLEVSSSFQMQDNTPSSNFSWSKWLQQLIFFDEMR